MHEMSNTAISQGPFNSNTAIDPPFLGSSTDLAHVDSLIVPPSGSVAPNSLGPTNVVLLSRARTADPVATDRIGDYEIEGKIGEGAMGAVYRAVHPTIGKHVAVKVMNAKLCGDFDAVERFTREARSVAAIRHPGIVDVFGFGTLEDGRAYLIMEWLDGASLATRLRHGMFTQDEALDVLSQIARALEAAHDRGVIHRDLKPDNVFLQHVVRERPIVKILDFGLAKLVNEDNPAIRTQSGQMLGTPVYMSPEQCRAKDVDYRTDIYALGCIAYELLCGQVPFPADNTAELIVAHLGEPPPKPRTLKPDLPVALDELLLAMVAKDPAKRPTLQQVRQTIATLRGSAFPTPLPGQLVRANSRRAPRIVAVAALAVSAIAIGVVASSRHTSGVSQDALAAPSDAHVTVEIPDADVLDAPSGTLSLPDAALPKAVEKPTAKRVVKKPPAEKPVPAAPVTPVEKPDPRTTTINPFKKKKSEP
jgi:serine/threonine protein kinase